MTDVALEETENGIRLPVRARPKSRRNEIAGVHDGRLVVHVTEAPERGRANTALEKLLAKRLGLRRSAIALDTGATSTTKTFLVTDCTLADLVERIAAALPVG